MVIYLKYSSFRNQLFPGTVVCKQKIASMATIKFSRKIFVKTTKINLAARAKLKVETILAKAIFSWAEG